MGYQMEYDMQTIRIKKTDKRKDTLRYIMAVFALVVGGIGLHFGSAVLESVMFGKGQAVSVAAEEMVVQIQEGATLAEAVQVFCSEVGK